MTTVKVQSTENYLLLLPNSIFINTIRQLLMDLYFNGQIIYIIYWLNNIDFPLGWALVIQETAGRDGESLSPTTRAEMSLIPTRKGKGELISGATYPPLESIYVLSEIKIKDISLSLGVERAEYCRIKFSTILKIKMCRLL